MADTATNSGAKRSSEELDLRELLVKLEQMSPRELKAEIAAASEVLRVRGLKKK